MSGFFYELEGLDETTARFQKLVAMLTDLRPFWPKVVPLFIRWMAAQFESQGTWGGAHWAPLSPDYLAWKMQHYPGKPILQATGDLRQAASRPLRRATPLTLELLIDDSMYLHGAKKTKAGKEPEPRAVAPYHQFGGGSSEIGGVEGRPPQRQIIPSVLPDAALADLRTAADQYVTDLARKLGISAV
jgi:hypothetical protein